MELITLSAWLAACAFQDARQRQISNWLTFGAIALASIYLLFSGQTWLGAAAAEGGWALLLSLALTVPGYALGKLGGGDLKLLAGLALATDRLFLLGTFIGASVALVIWVVALRKLFFFAWQRVITGVNTPNINESKKHPFAPFLFIGFMMASLYFRQS